MLINLNIKNNLYWYSILLSEGFLINKTNNFDILIADNTDNFKQLLNKKSVVILDCNNMKLLPNNHKFIKSIKYDLNKNNFSYTINKNEQVTIDIYKSDNGFFICYNFDIELIGFQKQAKKKIILDYENNEFCYETLNKIDKNNVRKVLKSILRISAKLLNKKLFYIWKYPSTFSNVFNFRIDVDPERNRSEKEALGNIKKTINSFKNYSDFTTYAINFYRRHPNYKEFLNLFDNNSDLVSHNYLHINLPSFRHSYKNISKSLKFLQKNNFKTNIFVSPEYFYYGNLNYIFNELNIHFTSSLGYDFKSFPYRPVNNNMLSSAIEIPYHPLVFTKFAQGKSENIMKYYEKLINKIKNDNSLTYLLYDHPNVLSRYPFIIENILSLTDDLNLWKTTLTNFSKWLLYRESIVKNIDLNISGNILKCDYLKNPNYNVSLTIEDVENNLLYIKSLDSETNLQDQTSFKIEKKYENNLDFNSIGDTISYTNEGNINFFNNYKHFKKIIIGYYLYYKLKVNI